MSLILDALRKSEAERRRGDAPDLFAPMPAARHAARVRPAAVPALALAVTVTVAGAVWWWTHRAPPIAASAPREAPAVAAPAAPASDAAPVALPRTAPPERDAAEPAARAATPTAAAAGNRQARTAPRQPLAPASAPTPVTMPTTGWAPATVSGPEVRPAAPNDDADRPRRLGELDAARRATLPPLRLSMHVWDENPDHRFAIIDGQRVIEGSALGDTLVHEIRRDGVVLTIDGRDYLLPR